MLRNRLGVLALALVASPALPNTQPATAPAPSWLRPVAEPIASKPDDLPARLILQDQQVLLEGDRTTSYFRTVFRIQNPQGLSAANITVPWRPDLDNFTVHKLVVRRGDKIIDVLANQRFTVVRRESNLENAVIDGVLTATIQPEGLEVGDVIDFAASISSSDPALKGHAEFVGALAPRGPASRMHVSVQWPRALSIRLRQTGGGPVLKPVRDGDREIVELVQDNVLPPILPKYAPVRYRLGRLAEFSNFASWSDLARLLGPQFDRASVVAPGGPVAAEIAKIKAASTDPQARAGAALALVEDRIRYVAISIGDAALVPADAETTWQRRFGDCKAKTVLLVAMLHALGIDAVPVLVSSTLGDGLDQRLPLVGAFDHVVVRATIAGRTYWLDGTRSGDVRIADLRTPDFRWGLPLISTGSALVPIVPDALTVPDQVTDVRIDARKGLVVPAPFHVEMRVRGDGALGYKQLMANLAPDARDRALRDYWKKQYDFVSVKTVAATFDPATREELLTMDGDAKMDWSTGFYEADGVGVGYKADFVRDPGSDVGAPYAVDFPSFTRSTESIQLPPGFHDSELVSAADIDRTIAGIQYHRRARIADAVFTVEESERSVIRDFPASAAPAAQVELRALAAKTLYLRKPTGYKATDQEVAEALAQKPADASAYFDRARLLFDRNRFNESIKDFDAVLALDPKHAYALANRGLAYAWLNDAEHAKRDIDAALAIDARNAVAYRARGVVAEQQGRPLEAIAAYSTSLDIDPVSDFAVAHRATLYRATGQYEKADADAARVLKTKPDVVELYLLRANALRAMGRTDDAIAQARALITANPKNTFAQVAAAKIFASFHHNDEAMKAFDAALAIKPEAYIYINRSEVRPHEDLAGRRADLQAALKLDPTSSDAIGGLARIASDSGDYREAVAAYTRALAADPKDALMLNRRGIANMQLGQTALADADFAAAHIAVQDAKPASAVGQMLNTLCYAKAIANVALARALSECDLALSGAPGSAPILDSRGYALLRLGRLDEAIADFSAALAKAPKLANSLFGRSLAWARKGDKVKSDADMADALKISPEIEASFKRQGLSR